MQSKAKIARAISSKVKATKEELVQYFHSTFYIEGLSEEQYISSFIAFQTELDEFLIYCKDWDINKTFLKGKEFTTTKIPLKVLKQLELEYQATQDYIQQVIKEINSED